MVVLLAVMGYSGFRLWDIYSNRASERVLHEQLLIFRPTMPYVQPEMDDTDETQPVLQSESHAGVINQGVIDLQEIYPSVVGWLTVPGTAVDHPFVQASNNSFYLHRDINHNNSPAGTVFMDSRNCSDFTDFNTLIYGHNMRNGSMFGTLREFHNRQFFDDNESMYVFLPYRTYAMDILAIAVIQPNDPVIYGLDIETDEDKTYFVNYVRRIAQHHRDIVVTPDDRVVTLSTCRNDAANLRMVLIGVIR